MVNGNGLLCHIKDQLVGVERFELTTPTSITRIRVAHFAQGAKTIMLEQPQ